MPKGKTYFHFNTTLSCWVVVVRDGDKHFRYCCYYNGRPDGVMRRCTQRMAANYMQLSIAELLELFKLD